VWWVVNNQIKKDLLLNLPVKIVGKVRSKKVRLSRALCAVDTTLPKVKKVHDTIHLLPVTRPNIHTFFTGKLNNKRFLIWLLMIPLHLKYVTTVPCNLSLITTLVCDCRSFSDISVSQGSAARHRGCCKFTGKSDSEKFLKIGSELTVTALSLVSPFWSTVYVFCVLCNSTEL